MQFKTLSVFSLAASAVSAATDHTVAVGQSGLTYSPSSVNASVGDTVTFHFYPSSHNVVQAAFASPCTPLSNGFYSGFQTTSSGEANMTYTITINDTKPIWFYCSRSNHCEQGMVGVINQAATGANTLAAFKEAAAKVSNSTTPTVANGEGGQLKATSGASTLTSSLSIVAFVAAAVLAL